MALMDLIRPEKEAPAPPPPESHKGRLEIGGQFPIEWDTAVPVTVAKARDAFNTAILSGYAAQSYKPTKAAWGGMSYAGEMTREFDPEADMVVMALPYAGG